MANLSIIIPVYNANQIIKEKTTSILDSLKESYEVIFVDDGSTDGSADLLNNLIAPQDNVFLFRLDKNYGAGYARNVGIQNARGEYVYFFDIDDEFVGFDILEKMYQTAKENACVICGGSVALVKEKKRIASEKTIAERVIEVGDDIDDGYTFHNDGMVSFPEYQYDYGFMRFIYQTEFLRENHIEFPLFKRYQDPPFMIRAFQRAKHFYAMKDITYIMNAHEKKVWNEIELQGLCDGLEYNLQFAIKEHLEICYKNNIFRIFSDFGKLWTKYQLEESEFMSQVKKAVKLQNILFPCEAVVADKDLFYRSGGTVFQNEEGALEFVNGVVIDFGTYFNAFSSNGWKKYTDVHNVSLVLKYSGGIEATLYSNKILYGKMEEELIGVRRVYSSDIGYACFDFGELREVENFSFKVTAIGDVSYIYEGFYITNTPCMNRNIKLAIIFCTYNREQYIKKNVAAISELNDDCFKTYVVDNAQSLNQEELEGNCELVSNKNVGGAGGFSKGMLQVMKEQDKEQFTHFILMDDDVLLDSRILTRLKLFLGRVAGKHQQSFVGGAMLRKDIKYYQVESGAIWNGGFIQSNGHGRDMRSPFNCLMNEQFDTRKDYNAWWFCTVPIEYLRPDNLPLPIFFCNDDVDYGLRNKAPVITMNGICTWHDPFDSKLSAMRLYYENRNRLIVNSVHNMAGSKQQVIKSLKQTIKNEIYLYRYQNAKSIIRGVDDFLKGTEWLCSLDAENYNQEILSYNCSMTNIEKLGVEFDYEWYRVCCEIKDCDRLHKWVRILTFNGLLLKANRRIILPLYAVRPVQGYRATEILYYDEITNKGYLEKKDWREIRECFRLYYKMKRKINKSYEHAVKEYRERYRELITKEMWEKIGGMLS